MTLPVPGQPFGPYTVERSVGQGGFGAVFRARDTRLGRVVALKVMRDVETADPEMVTRFLREGRLAAALEHPNIVHIHDVGTHEGTPYIVMEWIEGTTLGRATIERKAELLATVAETLAFAHARGIVHRDLKPANVMIDGVGRPKLVDFGIARRVVPSATFATQDGSVLGTPQYMAPEQMLSSAVDPRADQYAWGVIAYELFTGERPDRPALAHAALDHDHGPVIMRALEMLPSQRFASMDDLLAAWRAPPAPAAAPVVGATVPKRRSRTTLFLASAGAVTLVGTVVLAAVVSSRASPVSAPLANVPEASVSPAASSSEIAPETAPEMPPEGEPPPDVPPSTSAAPGTPPRPNANAAPPRPRAKRIAKFVAEAMSSISEDELLREMATVRPALERCIVGSPVGPGSPRIEVKMTVFAGDRRPIVSIVDRLVVSPARRPGASMAAERYPALEARSCIEAVLRAMKIQPTTGRPEGSVYLGILPE